MVKWAWRKFLAVWEVVAPAQGREEVRTLHVLPLYAFAVSHIYFTLFVRLIQALFSNFPDKGDNTASFSLKRNGTVSFVYCFLFSSFDLAVAYSMMPLFVLGLSSSKKPSTKLANIWRILPKFCSFLFLWERG